jgi:chitodextrinase
MNHLFNTFVSFLALMGLSTPPPTSDVLNQTTKTTLTQTVSQTTDSILRTALTATVSLSLNGVTVQALEEQGSMAESTSADWWLNSGAYYIDNGDGTQGTIQGSLASNDPWRTLYATDNPVDTDNGYHPQNIFRLVSRTNYENYQQEAYFKITKQNLSASTERDAWSGLLLFNRYRDSDNLYYAGIRADGTAVIKSKKNGNYTTMTQNTIFPGTYNRVTNPNLLPQNTWIGLRTRVQTNIDGSVTVTLYMDNGRTGTWTQIATATDRSNPILGSHAVGIRTDFMDVLFSNFSSREFDTTPPVGPTTLSLLSKTNTQVRISWTPATDNVGVVGYNIYKDGVYIDGTQTATSYTAGNLNPNTQYLFSVKARDAIGNISLGSPVLTVSTLPSVDSTAPIISNVTTSSVTQTTANIGWSTNEGADSKVEYGMTTNYDGSANTTLYSTAHTLSLTGLAAGTTYHYKVTSKDIAGNSTSSSDATFTTLPVVSGVDSTPPSAPTNLLMLSNTSTKIRISWTPATDNVGVVGYNIYKNGVFIDSTRTATSFSANNLRSNTQYTFTVKARDAVGNISPVSNSLTVSTLR